MGDDLDGLFGETKDECLEAIAQAVVQGNMQLAEGGVRVLVENYKLGLADIRKQFIGKKGHVCKRVHSVVDDHRRRGLEGEANALAARLTRFANRVRAEEQASATSKP
jgi:hypothetical protein